MEGDEPVIESPAEDWQPTIEELAWLAKEGRLRGIAYIFHKPLDECTEDSHYRTGSIGYPECMEHIRQALNVQAAIKGCCVPETKQ